VINSVHVTGLTRLDMRPQLGGMKAKWPNRRRKPSENGIALFGKCLEGGSENWFIRAQLSILLMITSCVNCRLLMFGTGAAQFLQLLRSLEKEDVSGQICALSDQVRAYFLPPMTPPIHSSAAVPTSSS
jgi:hypothetical protein